MKNVFSFLFILALAPIVFGQDLNKETLDKILSESAKTNTDALIISKDGKIVHKNYFGKDAVEIEAMSATKSIVGLAVAMLVDKGFLKSFDEPVSTFYPEWETDEKKDITIRHLLNHTSGLQNVSDAGIEVETSPDVIRLALDAKLETNPGEVYSYNNKATNLLVGVVEKASRTNFFIFLQKNLFDPLNIKKFHWRIDKKGNFYGYAGLEIYPEDFIKIGQLLLNKGIWNGKRIIGEKVLKTILSPGEKKPEYGLLWGLIYEKQFMVIDDIFLSRIKSKTDAETFAFLEKIKGRYESYQAILANIRKTIPEKNLTPATQTFSGVPPSEIRIDNEGKIVGYVAAGFLGQYLIILPKRNIVVVRMISAESHRKIPNNSDFTLLRRLAKQL